MSLICRKLGMRAPSVFRLVFLETELIPCMRGPLLDIQVIPRAVSWFTGEAMMDEDDDEEDEEDDDEVGAPLGRCLIFWRNLTIVCNWRLHQTPWLLTTTSKTGNLLRNSSLRFVPSDCVRERGVQ